MDNCGHPTAEGEACMLPESYPDGRCHHHTETKEGLLTEDLIDEIAHVIEQGGSRSEACRKQGIHRETFYRWIRRGENEEDTIYAQLCDRLTRALGQGEGAYRSALMQIAIETDDTATLMAMLKQRYPDSWGEVDRGEQDGATNQAIMVIERGDDGE